MPYNPFQQMILEMLLGQMQQQGNPFGGGMGFGGGFGGQQGMARGTSPFRGIPSGLGVSSFQPPPVQGGYQMQDRPKQGGFQMQGRPQQGGWNTRRREQPPLTYQQGRSFDRPGTPERLDANPRPYERRKRGQQEAPRYWGLGFSGR